MARSKVSMYAFIGASSLALLAGLAAAVTVRSRQGQEDKRSAAQTYKQSIEKESDDAATPVVDFDSSDAAQLNGENRRKQKGARFDKYGSVLRQPPARAGESILYTDWEVGLADLPIDKSDIVVEGEVIEANAFLSNDKTGVYSEFTVRADKILKAAPDFQLHDGDTIVAERYGGRVRYPSGKIIRYRVAGQGSPATGKTYLFFLTKAEQGDYKILTAYELQENKIFALDGSRVGRQGGGAWAFDKHNGQETQKFLEEVQRVLSDSVNSGQSLKVGRP